MKREENVPKGASGDVHIQEFLDMIAPSVIKFETDYFICGNTFRCVWALREYPTFISNAANKNRMARGNTNDLQTAVLAESNLQDVAAIVAQMHRNREPLLHTAAYLELCAHETGGKATTK